jgi:hypothetical protein
MAVVPGSKDHDSHQVASLRSPQQALGLNFTARDVELVSLSTTKRARHPSSLELYGNNSSKVKRTATSLSVVPLNL